MAYVQPFEAWEKEKLNEYMKLLQDLDKYELIAVCANALIYADGLKIKTMIAISNAKPR